MGSRVGIIGHGRAALVGAMLGLMPVVAQHNPPTPEPVVNNSGQSRKRARSHPTSGARLPDPLTRQLRRQGERLSAKGRVLV